ncbi:MAG: DnaJ domain-containing protein [Francisellaceae bacterium]|nr:DnaJ domain-containing protein [Francisellaceae bacterium]
MPVNHFDEFLSDNKSAYVVLGISETASPTDIAKAYKKIALKCHPDRTIKLTEPKQRSEAEDFFKKANNAKEILLDDDSRKNYDRALNVDKAKPAFTPQDVSQEEHDKRKNKEQKKYRQHKHEDNKRYKKEEHRKRKHEENVKQQGMAPQSIEEQFEQELQKILLSLSEQIHGAGNSINTFLNKDNILHCTEDLINDFFGFKDTLHATFNEISGCATRRKDYQVVIDSLFDLGQSAADIYDFHNKELNRYPSINKFINKCIHAVKAFLDIITGGIFLSLFSSPQKTVFTSGSNVDGKTKPVTFKDTYRTQSGNKNPRTNDAPPSKL